MSERQPEWWDRRARMWVASVCFAVAFAASLFEGRLLSVAWSGALLAWALLGATGLDERSRAARWSGYALVGVGLGFGAVDLLARSLA